MERVFKYKSLKQMVSKSWNHLVFSGSKTMSSGIEIIATPLDDKVLSFKIEGLTILLINPLEDFSLKTYFRDITEVVDKITSFVKGSDVPWQILGKTIGNIIRICYKANRLIILEGILNQAQKSSDNNSNIS